uniref:Uncharacterized protein n=1 Tax=Cacopsylla melanoneura TaxID=428564 RepID=A0A8D9F0I3_9HEMI
MPEVGSIVYLRVEPFITVGVHDVNRLTCRSHVTCHTNVDGKPALERTRPILLLLIQITRLKVEHTGEAALVRLVEEKYLHPLTLDERLGVSQDSEHHVLYCTLFFEYHSG